MIFRTDSSCQEVQYYIPSLTIKLVVFSIIYMYNCLVAKAAGGTRDGSNTLATETEESPLVGG